MIFLLRINFVAHEKCRTLLRNVSQQTKAHIRYFLFAIMLTRKVVCHKLNKAAHETWKRDSVQLRRDKPVSVFLAFFVFSAFSTKTNNSSWSRGQKFNTRFSRSSERATIKSVFLVHCKQFRVNKNLRNLERAFIQYKLNFWHDKSTDKFQRSFYKLCKQIST